MVSVEILFLNGQGISLQMESTQQALEFIERIKKEQTTDSLFHFSAAEEELLLNLTDISYVRLKKSKEFVEHKKREDAYKDFVVSKQFDEMQIDEEIRTLRRDLEALKADMKP